MRIEQLEYLTAVVRLGSFRKAAESLHISQPALSESVRRLEGELGVEVLDRHRSGAKLSAEGREILPHILAVIESADQLRLTAGHQSESTRMIRVGTVGAASAPVMTAAIKEFREAHERIQVEVVVARQSIIHEHLKDGSLDIGLVNYLEGDPISGDFETVELMVGRPVVCLHPSNPLAEKESITPEELARESLVSMRAGYVMHRFLTELLDGHDHSFSYSTDGAEMGKLMVAEALGVVVLPDFSVVGDPLERRGLITFREIEGNGAQVNLVAQTSRPGPATKVVSDLRRRFVQKADLVGRADGERVALS